MKRILFAFGIAALTIQPAAASSPFLIGVWGGDHAGIAFRGGLAEVKFDCASGSIDEPVYPAKDGSFTARGTFRAGSPGPVKVGQIFHSQPATYSGQVKKHVMTLSVELEDGTSTGPFTLNENAPSQLTRCL
jgi:hypothetical protein